MSGESSVSPHLQYHLSELAIIRDKNNPRRLVPQYSCPDWSILDIGCGMGQTLTAEEFLSAKELHGVDCDIEAIAHAQLVTKDPRMRLIHASGEQLPYADGAFNLVFSRVALAYMDIPKVLHETFRVLKPGGVLWAALHSWRFPFTEMRKALAARQPKAVIDRVYVITNSAVFHITGRVLPRPWGTGFESAQTERGMRTALHQAGFKAIEYERRPECIIMTARKPNI